MGQAVIKMGREVNPFVELASLMRDLENADSQRTILLTCLRHLVEMFGFVAGAAYELSADRQSLFLSRWYALNQNENLRKLRDASQLFVLGEKGKDVPVEVFLTKKLLWVEDYTHTESFHYVRSNLISDLELGAVIAVPVVVSRQVIAVLEFYCSTPMKEDSSAVEVLECIAVCGGVAIHQRISEEKLDQQQEKFRKNLEEKVQHLLEAKSKAEEASRSKTEFLANVSHELRTPMHAVMSYSDLGLKKAIKEKLDDKVIKYFKNINESGDRLLRFLNDLLDLSKLEAGAMNLEFGIYDMTQIVQHVAKELWPLMQNKKLTLDIVEREDIPCMVEVDQFRISQVLLNLISNAIKFSPEGAAIYITFEKKLWQKDNGQEVPALAVLVVDQGVGLPEGEQEAVFDKFVQSSKTKTGAGGTGLGLAICKEIIEGHGGTIYAENNMDSGATFTFEIPIRQYDVAAAESAAQPLT